MSKVLKSLAVVLVVAASGAAAAAEADKAAAPAKVSATGRDSGGRGSFGFKRLKRLDADRNGAVSKAEYLSPRIAEFTALDTNHDNAVDPAEIGAELTEPSEFRTKRYMKRVDANHDGKITREEFEQGPRTQFAGRDINSDGKINAEDRPPASTTSTGWFGGGGSKKMGLGAGRGNRPDLTLDTVVAKTQAEFARLDANADGVLDQAELAKQAAERIEFSKKRTMHWSDQNKDGRLSQDEFEARTLKRFSTLDLNDDGQIDASDFPSTDRKGWFSR